MATEGSSPDADHGTSELLRLTTYSRGRGVVIDAAGEVDMVTAPRLHDSIAAALTTVPDVLVVDLNSVTFLASCGLSELIQAQAAAGRRTRFSVVAATSVVRRPLQITGLDQEIPLFDSVDAALAFR